MASGFDPQLPTYVLAECVLVYMEADESAAVVRWLGKFLNTAACIVYEQVPSSTGRNLVVSKYRALAVPRRNNPSVLTSQGARFRVTLAHAMTSFDLRWTDQARGCLWTADAHQS